MRGSGDDVTIAGAAIEVIEEGAQRGGTSEGVS